MLQLITTFPHLVRIVQQTVHRPRGTVINAFVQQRGLDLGRSLIDKSRRVEHDQNRSSFGLGKRSWRRLLGLLLGGRTRRGPGGVRNRPPAPPQETSDHPAPPPP